MARGAAETPGGRNRVSVFLATLGAAVVVIGAVLAFVGYRRTGGPEGAVRGYYAALADGDASRALAWGSIPPGPRILLTDAVLTEQQRLAPIRDLHVGTAERTGTRARVPLSYRLDFPAGSETVRQIITVLERDGDWRLAAVAAPVSFELGSAADRAGVLGARVPETTVLAFPGAAPITFDSTYLTLKGSTAQVVLGGSGVVAAEVALTESGRNAALGAVRAALARCVRGNGDTACPLPGPRYVPGSLQGTVSMGSYGVTVTGDRGLLDITGTARFQGSYRTLTFANRQQPGKGSAMLQVHARMAPLSGAKVSWVTT